MLHRIFPIKDKTRAIEISRRRRVEINGSWRRRELAVCGEVVIEKLRGEYFQQLARDCMASASYEAEAAHAISSEARGRPAVASAACVIIK